MGQEAELKVGIVTPFRVRCGVATYSEDLTKALADLGVSIYVIRLHRLGAKRQPYYEHLASRRIPEGLDLLHVQWEYGLFGGFERVFYALAKDLHDIPIVTTAHATGWRQELDEAVGELSDLVIVHNQFCKMKFMSRKKPAIIPHGITPWLTVPEDEAKRKLGLEGPTVGTFGFQSPNKRLEDFLVACKVMDVTPVVIGGFLMEVETKYMHELKRLGGDKVKWLGFVPTEEMPTVMGAIDVCVHTSSYVSESGAIATMLGYGKAVVARDLPPNREKPCLELFKTATDLKDKIKHLIETPSERAALEAKAMKYAQENRWETIARKHISFYKELLK